MRKIVMATIMQLVYRTDDCSTEVNHNRVIHGGLIEMDTEEGPTRETDVDKGVPRILNKETDPILIEQNEKIEEAFDVFDHDNNKTIDVREFGTVVRSLGCCPNEAELQDMIQIGKKKHLTSEEMEEILTTHGAIVHLEVEEEEPTGFICFEKFQPMMARVLVEKRYKPAGEDQLLKAFQVLDKDKKKHLTREEMKEILTTHGEVFQQEEIDEMLQAATDPDRGVIMYEEYVRMMLPEEGRN